jgi:TonB family protein
MKHPEKKFLKRPEYPGGKERFKAYIRSSLVYPREALEKGIEGIVYLRAVIDDNGTVLDVVVEKGIGGGCDEEAVRLIKNVHFGAVKNRGLRLKTRKKFRIEFKLPVTEKSAGQSPQRQVSYQVSPSKKKADPAVQKKEAPPQQAEKKYSYSIRLHPED